MGKAVGDTRRSPRCWRTCSKTYAMEAIPHLGSLLSDAGQSDIRLEAAVAKLWNSDVAWDVADQAMQVRGGRGYETARSLASRGEAPIPLEQMLRDLRINRIFEGTNQVMRLFIAREALDVHLRVAGDVVMPGVPLGKRLAGAGALGAVLRTLVSDALVRLWTVARYSEFGELTGHLRWVESTSRRLARAQFHLMVAERPRAREKAGAAVRCVDIGAELFAMTATCVRALTTPGRARLRMRSSSPICSAAMRGARSSSCSKGSGRTAIPSPTASRAACWTGATSGSKTALSMARGAEAPPRAARRGGELSAPGRRRAARTALIFRFACAAAVMHGVPRATEG